MKVTLSGGNRMCSAFSCLDLAPRITGTMTASLSAN